MAVSLSCLVSCGSDPLDSCDEETDGTLDCSFAEFNNVDLSGRDLRNVDLSNADLEQANLTGADLSWTGLSGGRGWRPSLYGANLAGADLSGTDLRGAVADEDTIWPEGFDPEAAGVFTFTV